MKINFLRGNICRPPTHKNNILLKYITIYLAHSSQNRSGNKEGIAEKGKLPWKTVFMWDYRGNWFWTMR